MKYSIVIALVFLFLINGCSHHILRNNNENDNDFYKRVTELCKDKDEVTIEMLDGKQYKGNRIAIAADSTEFNVVKSDSSFNLFTKEIREIKYNQLMRGALEGLLFGAVVGGSLGLLQYTKVLPVILPLGSDYYLLNSTFLGSIAGFIYGLINSSKITIIIN